MLKSSQGLLSNLYTVFQDENRCCETGKLKTEDNNWEKGQVNYFVGFQMGDCADFNLDGKGNITFDGAF